MAVDATKSLEFAADLAKQIITVATGTLAFTITFAEKFDPDGKPPLSIPSSMYVYWIGYVMAIAGAVWFLMAAAGSVNRIAAGDTSYANIMNSNTRVPAIVMVFAFVVALVATVWAGWSITA